MVDKVALHGRDILGGFLLIVAIKILRKETWQEIAAKSYEWQVRNAKRTEKTAGEGH